MSLATQFADRVGATPGTSLARQYLGGLVVADSCVKSGALTSFATNVLTFGAMVVVINAADGTPAQEVQKAGGPYTITGGTNTDNYVFLSTAGAYSQTAVTRGSGPPSVPSGSICLLFATIAGTAGTIISTTNVAPTVAQLLATSISAHAPAAIPGFTWTAAKSVGDQLSALGTAITAVSGGTGGEIAGTDFKASGLTGATAGARLVGGTASGHPTTGPYAKGDTAVDQTGSLWICTTAGTPGTWRQAGDGALGTGLTVLPSTNATVSAISLGNGVTFFNTVKPGCGDSLGSFAAAPPSNATSPIQVIVTPVTPFTTTTAPLAVLFYSVAGGASGLAFGTYAGGTAGNWNQFNFPVPQAVSTGVILSCAYIIIAVGP